MHLLKQIFLCCALSLILSLLPSVYAAPATGLPLTLSAEESVALCSSRVRDRDLLINNWSTTTNAAQVQLLQAIADGELYCKRSDQSLWLKNADGSFNALTSNATLTNGKGLRRVGSSNKQRQLIATIVAARALYSEEVSARRAAAAALLQAGATLPSTDTLQALMQHEDDGQVYQDLRTAWALTLAQNPSLGRQELLQAVEILKDKGTPQCLNALEQLGQSSDEILSDAAQQAAGWVQFYLRCATFGENLFFGLSLGSVLVLAAIGLAITFGVMGVINMAHGELIMVGAYCVWCLQQLLPGQPGLALILAIPTAFVVSGTLGMLIERTVICSLYGRPLETLLATFGVSLILQQAVRTIFSPLNRAVQTPAFMQGQLQISENLSVTLSRVIIILFCALTFTLILIIMNKTRLGLEVRALAQNRPIARALGVRAGRIDALTFGLGSGVAGMAGVALSQITNVGPNLGQNYIVDTFMVVVFGGVGNLWGTLTGGLIMGLISKFLEPVTGAMLSKIVILIALILFIQKRPRGLFPQRGRAAEA